MYRPSRLRFVSLLLGAMRVGVALAVAGLAVATPQVAAQGGCQFGSGSGVFHSIEIPGAGRVTYVGTPHFVCSEGVQIWADSAEAYSAQNMSLLLGHVRYVDRTRELRADEARYFTQAARIQASGHVFMRDTIQGSEIENGNLVYLRRASFREQEQITVTTGSDGVRPRARLYMKPPPPDSAARPGAGIPPAPARLDTLAADTAAADTTALPDTAAAEPEPIVGGAPDTVKVPYVVDGDRLFLQGDQYFLATGDVVVERDSLTAWADTAEYDQVAARMLLKGSARMEGETYTLAARTINVALPGGEVGNVRAVREAVLTGEDLRLQAPLIRLFTTDGVMDRLVATPLPGDPFSPPATAADSADLARPIADAEEFRLVADSVEVTAPAEVLSSLHAVGRARGESSARDSLNVPSLPEIAKKDWLEGDTIVASFAKLEEEDFAPGDTVREGYRIDQLVAKGKAKSLYRLIPSDSTWHPGVDAPAVHYVTGAGILITFADGEVDRMEVTGPTHGWHLEPGRRADKDSLAAIDTVPPPDTGRVDARGGAGRTGAGGREGVGPPPTAASGKGVALPGAAPLRRGRSRGGRR